MRVEGTVRTRRGENRWRENAWSKLKTKTRNTQFNLFVLHIQATYLWCNCDWNHIGNINWYSNESIKEKIASFRRKCWVTWREFVSQWAQCGWTVAYVKGNSVFSVSDWLEVYIQYFYCYSVQISIWKAFKRLFLQIGQPHEP